MKAYTIGWAKFSATKTVQLFHQVTERVGTASSHSQSRVAIHMMPRAANMVQRAPGRHKLGGKCKRVFINNMEQD